MRPNGELQKTNKEAFARRTFKRNGLMNKRKPLLSGCADFLPESVLVFELGGFVGNFNTVFS